MCERTVSCYLVHTAQRRLRGTGDQVSPDSDHVDLVLLRYKKKTVSGKPKKLQKDVADWTGCLQPTLVQRRGSEITASPTGHALGSLTLRLISVRLLSEMLFVPTMMSESKAGAEKLWRRSR